MFVECIVEIIGFDDDHGAGSLQPVHPEMAFKIKKMRYFCPLRLQGVFVYVPPMITLCHSVCFVHLDHEWPLYDIVGDEGLSAGEHLLGAMEMREWNDDTVSIREWSRMDCGERLQIE